MGAPLTNRIGIVSDQPRHHDDGTQDSLVATPYGMREVAMLSTPPS
jgi:hypothetical protein